MERVDVVVVGAGAMGSAAAWCLARRGRSVVLLERFEQGHARGSSHGATRIFRFAYRDPSFVAMARQALPRWRELEDDAGATLLQITGGVDHGRADDVAEVAAALRVGGGRHEILGSEAAAERWPGLRFEGSVVFSPDAGRCLADATVRALHERASAHGADVRFGVGPATVEQRGDRAVVIAGDDEWDAPVAILTCGSWIGGLAASLDIPLPPLRVTSEQVQHFPLLDPNTADGWPSFIHHRRPWIYGLYSPGEGVKVAAHFAGADVDPDARSPRDAEAEAAVVRHVEEWFPGLDPTPVHRAECLYTTTPDESFVIERRGPLVVGSACSGHGFKFTPLIGRRLADLAEEAL